MILILSVRLLDKLKLPLRQCRVDRKVRQGKDLDTSGASELAERNAAFVLVLNVEIADEFDLEGQDFLLVAPLTLLGRRCDGDSDPCLSGDVLVVALAGEPDLAEEALDFANLGPGLKVARLV